MKLTLHKKQKPEIFERRKVAGGPTPKVFSYYARGNSPSSQNTGRRIESDSAPETRSYKRLIYLPSYIALAAVIIAGVYTCLLQTNPKVVMINVPGSVFRSTQDYQAGISAIWRHSILNQTKLTVQGATIKRDILEQYGELSDVQLELPLLGRRPTVVLTPAPPALQYISSNGMFYVNTKGQIMAKVTEVIQNQVQNIPLVRDESGIAAEVGKSVVPEYEAQFLVNLSAELSQESVGADSITLPATAANEADVRITGKPYYIKFSTLSDPRQSVGAYQAIKTKLEIEGTTPKEYIDVRVDEKVFYK